MKSIMMKKLMRPDGLLAVVCAAALGSAFATTREWSGGDGGDLATDSNWTTVSDGGTVSNYFRTGGTGLTLSQDYTFSGLVQVETDNSYLSFDIGKDRTLTFSDSFFCNAHNATVELLSGTYVTPNGKDFVPCSSSGWGDLKQNNVFRIKGADTYLNVNGRMMLAYKSNNAVFELTDGAHFYSSSTGGLDPGNNNPQNSKVKILNGASFVSDQAYAFCANKGLTTIVSNATMTIINGWSSGSIGGTDCLVGVYDGGKLEMQQGHIFIAGPRSKLVVEGEGSCVTSCVTGKIGYQGYGESSLIVTNNGYAIFCRGLHIGGDKATAYDDKGNPIASPSNLVHVTTGGRLVCNGGTYSDEALTIGDFYNKGADTNDNPLSDDQKGNINNGYSRLFVENGGSVSNPGWYSTILGCKSSSNRIDVTSGGRFANVGPFRIGDQPEAKGNVVRVYDGGILEQNGSGIWIGKQGSSNRFEVANATATFANGDQIIYVGFTNCTGNAMSIQPGGHFLGRSGENRTGKIYVGYGANTEDPAPGHDSLLEVLGGELSVKEVQVGLNGSSGNTVVISNGTVDVSYFASSHFDTTNALVIKGTTPSLAGDTVHINTNTEVVFDFADGVYEAAPITGGINIHEGSTVRFTNVESLRRAENRRCELVRTTGTDPVITDEILASWQAALPERCSLRRSSDGKAILFHASSDYGSLFIIR